VKKIVYCAQFLDLSGYGIAARRYLDALDLAISAEDVDLKIYTTVAAGVQLNSLSHREQELITKYSFKNDAAIAEFIQDNDYECIWHMPTPMPLFADSRFSTTEGIQTPSLSRIIKAAKRNHHLVVWETTDISTEWKESLEWFKPHSIITACKMNVELYSKYCENVLLAPHPIYDVDSINSRPLTLPQSLEDKFVIFSMSQWTHRKGFDKLIAAFTAELGDKEDCLFILKTFESAEAGSAEQIANTVKSIRAVVNKEEKKNNILLLPSYIAESNIKWLYENSDMFALLPRGEGFGLTIFEAILNGVPVMVPDQGGHLDYIDSENKFMVSGMWDSCIVNNPVYSLDSEWYEPNIASARQKLRLAYNMWKENTLATAGTQSKEKLLNNPDYDSKKIGQDIIDFVTQLPVTAHHPKVQKRNLLKKQISLTSDLQAQVDILKDAYEGDTAYILNCGPSLSQYSEEFLNEFLADKLTISVKQAYSAFKNVTDFHFFNCANLPMPTCAPLLQHYEYDEESRPIIIASSNYDLGQRWHPCQKHDLYFKIPIRTEINNEFVTITKKFDDFLLSNSLTRPCGPGIMLETVLFLTVHLGVKNIVGLGWDLTNDKVNEDTYQHFYGNTQNLFNRGDVLDWEIEAGRESSKDVYYWLKDLGINLQLVSDISTLYDGIERINLD
jgi:glycosyltransferase involved in cell wall biosynthesis